MKFTIPAPLASTDVPTLATSPLHFSNSKGCWPSLPGVQQVPLSTAEFADIAVLLIPFYSAVAPLISLIGNGFAPTSMPAFPLPALCTPTAAMNTFNAMIQAFGVMGVSAYLLPVLNLVITLSAILGVSGLLGGDTSLAGISKLL